MIKTAMELKYYRLISLCGGNVSVRLDDGNFLITPSGMEYDNMKPEDICKVNSKGEVIEGKWRASSDTLAILYIFENMPEMNAVIHTHQPYATAISLVEDEFPPCCVTQIDALRGKVSVAPFTISGDKGMGPLTCEYMENSFAVILKNHGVMAVGVDLKKCLYAAVYLEESAKTYCIARSMSNPVVPMSASDTKAEAKDISRWMNYHQG
ncbi:class II aldolase/adducin family protein [Colidextribacter sp. OB.20]|nr:class II aldolase/adducin family protein [Colidextribacter sp. OB.20]